MVISLLGLCFVLIQFFEKNWRNESNESLIFAHHVIPDETKWRAKGPFNWNDPLLIKTLRER